MEIYVLDKEYIFEPEKFFLQCHASTLLVLDSDEILVAWFAGTREKHPDVAIWLSRRINGQWSSPIKVADKENIPCWNPVLFKGEQNLIYLFYKVGEDITRWRTMVVTSSDGGYTWSKPKELIEGDIGGRGPVKNKPIITSDGTWIAPASIETQTDWDVFVDISKDQGKTWNNIMVPRDRCRFEGKGLIQPTLWESQPGVIHMLIRSTEGFIYRSDSEDNGATWSVAYPIDLPNNNSGIDLVKMKNGHLILVYNPVTGNWAQRTPLVCSISKDNGFTWEDRIILDHNEDPQNREDGEFSYPAIVAYRDNVYITYTWKRRSIMFYKLKIIYFHLK